jgi:hypothetical protein
MHMVFGCALQYTALSGAQGAGTPWQRARKGPNRGEVYSVSTGRRQYCTHLRHPAVSVWLIFARLSPPAAGIVTGKSNARPTGEQLQASRVALEEYWYLPRYRRSDISLT